MGIFLASEFGFLKSHILESMLCFFYQNILHIMPLQGLLSYSLSFVNKQKIALILSTRIKKCMKLDYLLNPPPENEQYFSNLQTNRKRHLCTKFDRQESKLLWEHWLIAA